MFGAQREEQVRLGRITIIGAVVDDRRHVWRGFEDCLEVVALRRDRQPARQDPRNDHQPGGAELLRVGGMGHGRGRVDRAGADDDRHTGAGQALHALHALGVGQKRPVPAGPAIDHARHARCDQFLSLAHQRVEIGLAVGGARGQQRGDRAEKDIFVHGKAPLGVWGRVGRRAVPVQPGFGRDPSGRCGRGGTALRRRGAVRERTEPHASIA